MSYKCIGEPSDDEDRASSFGGRTPWVALHFLPLIDLTSVLVGAQPAEQDVE